MNRFALLLSTLFAVGAISSAQAQTGAPPAPGLGARNIFTEYRLPSLQDRPGDRLWRSTHRLQVLERARLLKLNAHSATEAWSEAEDTYRAALRTMAADLLTATATYNGTTASGLNLLLANDGAVVRVTSPSLQLDVPIRIAGTHVDLDLGTAKLSGAAGEPYMIRIENASDVRLSGGELTSGNWGLLIAGSHHVAVTGMDVHDLGGGGIAVVGSQDVVVWNNRLHGLRAAAVLLNGATRRTAVIRNEIVRNLGSSNWNAGVVLTDRNADVVANPANLLEADGFWVKPQPMVERLTVPEDNLVAYNDILENASSGVYSDGSVRNVLVGNRIERNSKEGLCLDDGSTADVVAWNLFRANGKRWGKSDTDLRREFVLGLGRLPDGSSPAKVPAISLDNAAFNQVVFNEIDGNFGGGVKMVRTGLYNVIGLNLLTDDNAGQNARFHFFGIELGAAKADAPSVELDFTGSRGNEIFGNTIRGSHYAGIFFADGSDHNNVFDNAIFGATDWAMESVRVQPNYTLNNLTNLKLRNISSGLDPGLLKLGTGVMDTPPSPAKP